MNITGAALDVSYALRQLIVSISLERASQSDRGRLRAKRIGYLTIFSNLLAGRWQSCDCSPRHP
jgi:hypothetical protein